MAAFSCEDLHGKGLTLISSADEQFAELVEDIRRRTEVRNPGGPPFPPERIPANLQFAALLMNHSEKSIAALAIEWKFENVTGQHFSHRLILPFGRSLLLPFGARPEQLVFGGYWYTIFHGSKRLIADMKIFGDNTDVRPPRDEELWRGGGVGVGGGGGSRTDSRDLRNVVLAIDGAFFVDGEFIGPNRIQLWEDVYYEAEVKVEAAHIAAMGKAGGLSAAEIMTKIDHLLGRADQPLRPPVGTLETVAPEEFRAWHRGQLAALFSHVRQQQGDDAMVNMLVSWSESPQPQLRRS